METIALARVLKFIFIGSQFKQRIKKSNVTLLRVQLTESNFYGVKLKSGKWKNVIIIYGKVSIKESPETGFATLGFSYQIEDSGKQSIIVIWIYEISVFFVVKGSRRLDHRRLYVPERTGVSPTDEVEKLCHDRMSRFGEISLYK